MGREDSTESVIYANTPSVNGIADNKFMPKLGETSDFWRRLMQARAKVGGLSTTQAGIAKEMRNFVSHQSAVTNWKTGKKLPQLETVIELARTAHCGVDWLLTGRVHDFSDPPKEDAALKDLLTFWDKLTPENKTLILGIAKLHRSSQNTAAPERNKEVHAHLELANKAARAQLPHNN